VDYASRQLLRQQARRGRRFCPLDPAIHDCPVASTERAVMAKIEIEEIARRRPDVVLAAMGYPVRAIAREMGMPASSVYSRIERMRSECQDLLG